MKIKIVLIKDGASLEIYNDTLDEDGVHALLTEGIPITLASGKKGVLHGIDVEPQIAT